MTGSAWTRWTFCIDHYIILRGGVRGGEGLEVHLDSKLADDGKRLDALDVALSIGSIK